MKNYEKPCLETVSVLLDDVLLTSTDLPAFSIEGDKTAGAAIWQEEWNSLL